MNSLQNTYNKHLRIGMVTHGKFPPDPRIEKESLSLIKAGYEVYVYANREVATHSAISFKGVKVRYFSLRHSFFFLFIILPRILRRWFLTDEINVAHAQDTPLALPTIIVAKALHIPVIYDVHEIWHRMVAEDVLVSIMEKMLLIPWCKMSEYIGCKTAKAILVTSDEMASYIVQTYSVPPTRLHIVKNVCEPLSQKNLRHILLPKGIFKVCYVGNMNSGELLLDTVVRSATYLLGQMDFRFYIVGDGKIRPALEKLANRLNIGNHIDFTGWVPRENAYAYILASDICLLPYRRTFNTNLGCPHKLFEYMSLGKPIVMTALDSCIRMLGDAVYPWKPPTARRLAEIIYELHKNDDLRQRLGKACKKLVEDKYQWNNEEKKLLEIYKRFTLRNYVKC